MATAIPNSTNLVNIEETDFQSAISEATMQKLGGGINYAINTALGFDSRLTDLEGLTSFLPLAWNFTSTVQIFDIFGADISGQFVRRNLWYLSDGVKIFWGVMATFTNPITPPNVAFDVQLANLNVDTAKLELLSGSFYYAPMSFQSGGFSVPINPAIPLWNNSNYRLRLHANDDKEVRAFGILPRIY